MIQIGEDGPIGTGNKETPKDKPKWDKWDTIAVTWLGLVAAFLLTVLCMWAPKFMMFLFILVPSLGAAFYLASKYDKN